MSRVFVDPGLEQQQHCGFEENGMEEGNSSSLEQGSPTRCTRTPKMTPILHKAPKIGTILLLFFKQNLKNVKLINMHKNT